MDADYVDVSGSHGIHQWKWKKFLVNKSEKKAVCKHCCKEFSLDPRGKLSMTKVMANHSKICGPFSCHICSSKFVKMEELESHLKRIHPDDGMFKTERSGFSQQVQSIFLASLEGDPLEC